MHRHLQHIEELRAPQLPYELWEQILLQLPRSDQRSCLAVSKIAHDVALPLVFSRITVFFGYWQFAKDPIALEPSTQLSEKDDDAPWQNINTMNLLRHIVQEPELARLVKEMSVAAYVFADADATTEHTFLIEALRHLNLSSFFYYGKRPVLDTEIMEALAAGSGPTLRELRVPCKFRDDLPKSYCFPRYPQLETTIIVDINHTHTMDERRSALVECVTESAKPPARLCVQIPAWGPPGARLETSLRELELTNLAGYREGIEPILAFTQLRSLTLAGTHAYHVVALRAHPTALPHLTAFKLVPRAYNTIQMEFLSAFLMEKKHLTRLDVRYSSNLIEIIPHVLPSVLGVDFGSLSMAPEVADVFTSLDAHLPCSLSALLVHMPRWLSALLVGDGATANAWRALIRKRAGLRYIHFIGPGPSSTADRDDDHPQELCDPGSPPPSSLELIGDNARLRWVLPSVSSRSGCGAGAPAHGRVLSDPWPLSRVLFRRPADFGPGNEDWEWLLRHHDRAMFGGT